MQRNALIPLFVFLASGFPVAMTSCKNSQSTSDVINNVKTPVTVVHVRFKPVASTVEFPASSQFMNKNIVRAAISGVIESVQVRPGEYVNSDQLLFTLRTRESLAMGNMRGNDTSLLFKGRISITAHEPGVLNSIAYQKGDYVQEGDAIAVVSMQKSLIFIMDVPFEYQTIADKNTKCSIILPDKSVIDGTITGKLPEMEVQSQTVGYIIKPSETDRLPANLIAKVKLVKSLNNNATVLPRAAILSNETQTEFWVMKVINDSTAIRLNVRKGFENNEEIEITEPSFSPSDRIVFGGNYGLADTAGISVTREE